MIARVSSIAADSSVLRLPPTRAERLALHVMQLGSIAVVLVVAVLHAFELDRFFVPKELALHLTAVLAGLLTLGAVARVKFSRLDLLLMLFLVLGAVAGLVSTNPWLAMRALAITASGIVIFWSARALRQAGLSWPLLGTLAFAVTLAAAMSLLQTYGIDLVFFSENRAPGGTLGNRNFVAHVGAFGLPVVLLVTLRARRGAGYLAGCAATGVVMAALVLTRSRAAWLAAAAALLVFFFALLASRPLRGDGRTWRRLFGAAIVAIGAVAAALLIPNTLRWRSDNPYLESVTGVANYEEGSGRGRLVQYERSLSMAMHYPLFGVGPGNWPVHYPRHAPRNDPSLDRSEGGVTSNPWPSSDWISFAAERGLPAAVVMVLAFLGIAVIGLRRIVSAPDVDEGLMAAAFLATAAAAVVAGMFDAVLLLAVPCFIVWSALGALWSPQTGTGSMRKALVLATIAVSAIGAARSAAQLTAMQIYATRGDRASLVQAARIDPGNYRVRLRLARQGGGEQRCRHARAARALFPNADAAREVARRCN